MRLNCLRILWLRRRTFRALTTPICCSARHKFKHSVVKLCGETEPNISCACRSLREIPRGGSNSNWQFHFLLLQSVFLCTRHKQNAVPAVPSYFSFVRPTYGHRRFITVTTKSSHLVLSSANSTQCCVFPSVPLHTSHLHCRPELTRVFSGSLNSNLVTKSAPRGVLHVRPHNQPFNDTWTQRCGKTDAHGTAKVRIPESGKVGKWPVMLNWKNRRGKKKNKKLCAE